MRDDREYHICKQIAEYLRHQYPKVVFHFDYAGMKHTKAEAGRMKAIQGDRGFPDLFIAEPMMFAGGKGYSGLFIEVKAETPFKKDGSLFKQKQILYKEFGGRRVAVGEVDHLQEQYEMLKNLNNTGYLALFGTGFEEAKYIIDHYFNCGNDKSWNAIEYILHQQHL